MRILCLPKSDRGWEINACAFDTVNEIWMYSAFNKPFPPHQSLIHWAAEFQQLEVTRQNDKILSHFKRLQTWIFRQIVWFSPWRIFCASNWNTKSFHNSTSIGFPSPYCIWNIHNFRITKLKHYSAYVSNSRFASRNSMDTERLQHPANRCLYIPHTVTNCAFWKSWKRKVSKESRLTL